MSSFLSYNTDDPNAKQPALAANGVVTIGPVEAGVANKIAGSVFSDTAGTCVVYQSFDYFASGGGANPTPHWDIVQPVGGGTGAIAAGTPVTIDMDVLAPVLQVVFTNSATAQAHLRVFLRVFGQRNQA